MPAIPFIVYKQEDNRCIIHEDAKKMLSALRGPVCVLSIAGKYRSGKSTFLNKVILHNKCNTNNSFKVASTVNACTKGIWIYDKPITYTKDDGTQLQLLIIDTEGIGSLSTNRQQDCKILSLALLLSSFFVFNSIGAIDESSLDTLSIILNICQNINHSNDMSTGVEYKLPTFCWLLRDFTLSLQTNDGQEMCPDEYLEHSLTHIGKPCITSDSSENHGGINATKQLIKSSFTDRMCITMIRPCQEEKDLCNLHNLVSNSNVIRPSFQRQVPIIQKQIFEAMSSKTFANKDVTGKVLLNLAIQFVHSINEGSVPNISNSWYSISTIQNQEILDTTKLQFMNNIQKYQDMCQNKSPFFHEHLVYITKSIVHKSSDYLKLNSISGNTIKVEQYTLDFTEFSTEHVNNILNINLRNINEYIDNVLHILWEKHTVQNERNATTNEYVVKSTTQDDAHDTHDTHDTHDAHDYNMMWYTCNEALKNEYAIMIDVFRCNSTINSDIVNISTSYTENIWNNKIIDWLRKYVEHSIYHIQNAQCHIQLSLCRTMIKDLQDEIQIGDCFKQKLQHDLSNINEQLLTNQHHFLAEKMNWNQQITTLKETHVKQYQDLQFNMTTTCNKLQQLELEYTALQEQYDVLSESKEVKQQEKNSDDIGHVDENDNLLILKQLLCDTKHQLNQYTARYSELELASITAKSNMQRFIEDIKKQSVVTIRTLKEQLKTQKDENNTISAQLHLKRAKDAQEVNDILSLKQQLVDQNSMYLTQKNILKINREDYSQALQYERHQYKDTIRELKEKYNTYIHSTEKEYKHLQTKSVEDRISLSSDICELKNTVSTLQSEKRMIKRKLDDATIVIKSNKKAKLKVASLSAELDTYKQMITWLSNDKQNKDQYIKQIIDENTKLHIQCTKLEQETKMNQLKLQIN